MKLLPLVSRQQNMRARLANCLQYGDDRFKVSNMENRKFQINVSKVANTLLKTFATCSADCIFDTNTHTLVKHSVGNWSPSSISVVQVLVIHLDVSLLLDLLWTINAKTHLSSKMDNKTCNYNLVGG